METTKIISINTNSTYRTTYLLCCETEKVYCYYGDSLKRFKVGDTIQLDFKIKSEGKINRTVIEDNLFRNLSYSKTLMNDNSVKRYRCTTIINYPKDVKLIPPTKKEQIELDKDRLILEEALYEVYGTNPDIIQEKLEQCNSLNQSGYSDKFITLALEYLNNKSGLYLSADYGLGIVRTDRTIRFLIDYLEENKRYDELKSIFGLIKRS